MLHARGEVWVVCGIHERPQLCKDVVRASDLLLLLIDPYVQCVGAFAVLPMRFSEGGNHLNADGPISSWPNGRDQAITLALYLVPHVGLGHRGDTSKSTSAGM